MNTKSIIALITLAALAAEAPAAVTGRTEKTTPGGSEKILIDDSGVDKWISSANLFSGGLTITAPVVSGGLTASGSASNDFSNSTGTFKTSSGANTLSGAVTVADATTPSVTTASGKTNTGFVLINGKTSGGLKLTSADAAAYAVTVSLAAQTTGAATLYVNDLANTNGAVMTSTLTTNTPQVAAGVWGASNALVLEGATADAYETTISPADPTADRTITLPDASGTVRVAQASTAVSLTADNQAVTPGSANVLQLSSDNATATSRTFTLSATGAITGAIYILVGPATNGCELADTGIQKLSATWTPGATDTLTLLFDGTNFIELARADN